MSLITQAIGRTLTTRGVFYVVTRFGGNALRRVALDSIHSSSQWGSLESSARPEMAEVVMVHARGGRILDVGSGKGALAAGLDPATYQEYLGIEMSRVAVERAQSRQLHPKVRFEVQDIHRYVSSVAFDLILFEEAFYYINPLQRWRVLARYTAMLKPDGRIAMTFWEPDRFGKILQRVRRDFFILEDRNFADSKRWLLVFGLKGSRPNR